MNKRRKQSKLVRPSEQQWQALAQNQTLVREYSQLSAALTQAHASATQQAYKYGGTPDQYIDYTRAFTILERTPDLVPYLNSISKQSSSASSMILKESPTGNAHPQSGQAGGAWSGNKETDAVIGAHILRQWADSNEWVRAAINTRRQQIGRANISVIPFNERKPYNKSLVKKIQLLLDQPNEYRQNYYELMASCIDDVLVLDRGVILKDMTVDRKPVHLYNEDGACIKIYPNWSGKPKEPRYLYDNQALRKSVPLRNDECILMTANPATYRFGLSPVQVLKNTIQADLAATKSAMQMVDLKPPPHMIQLPGATQTQLEQIRTRYESDIAGRKEIFWIGGQNQANVTPLIFSARDNQWMEWQVYLARKIAIVFQISPQQLGITFDINKATASSQQEIFEDTGLMPLLLLIEEYFNTELLADFAPSYPDGRVNFEAINLRVLFPEVSEFDRQMHAERAIKIASTGLSNLPSMTLNQVLSLFGEEPVEGGNTFYAPTREGPLPWLSYDGKISEFGPLSTAGALGSQDPAGGPDTAEQDARTEDEGGNGTYAGPIQSQGNDSPEDQGVAAGKKDDGKNNNGKKSLRRQPGKRWLPNLL